MNNSSDEINKGIILPILPMASVSDSLIRYSTGKRFPFGLFFGDVICYLHRAASIPTFGIWHRLSIRAGCVLVLKASQSLSVPWRHLALWQLHIISFQLHSSCCSSDWLHRRADFLLLFCFIKDFKSSYYSIQMHFPGGYWLDMEGNWSSTYNYLCFV